VDSLQGIYPLLELNVIGGELCLARHEQWRQSGTLGFILWHLPFPAVL
jgi:hypothetical protein